MSTRSLALALGVLCLLTAPAAATNGGALTTIGTKGPVSIPVYGDPQNMFRMPSSIGWSWDHQIDLDIFLFASTTTLQNSLNDFEASGSAFGGSFGFVFAPGRPDVSDPDEVWDAYSPADQWTFGVGVYPGLAGGGGEKSDIRYTTFPETIGVATGTTFINNAWTVAYTPTEWLSLAGQVHLIYATVTIDTLVSSGDDTGGLDGSPQINGVPIPGNPSYSDFLNLFSNEGSEDPDTFFSGSAQGIHFAGALSISFKPADWLGFGLSYRSKSYGPPLQGTGEVDANRTIDNSLGDLGAPIEQLFLDTLPDQGTRGFLSEYDIEIDKLSVPRRITFNAVFWPLPNLLIAGEIAWIEWHRAIKEIEATLSNGSNRDLNFIIGSDGISTNLKNRFKNQWVFSLQTAWAVTPDLTLRFGYNYGRTPLNIDRQGNSPSSGFVEHHLIAGAGYRFGNLELNGLVEWGLPNTEQADGSSAVPTGRFSKYSSQQFFFHVGINYRF